MAAGNFQEQIPALSIMNRVRISLLIRMLLHSKESKVCTYATGLGAAFLKGLSQFERKLGLLVKARQLRTPQGTSPLMYRRVSNNQSILHVHFLETGKLNY